MPQDKEKKTRKEKSSGDHKDEEKFKRRNSLTDSASTTSSSSSSSASSDSSANCSVDSDEHSTEKGTMTKKENKGGSDKNIASSEGFRVEVIDRMDKLKNGENSTGNGLKNVSDNHTVPNDAHLQSISDDLLGNKNSSSKAANIPSTSAASSAQNKKKKNQKERKLTKKERKEQMISKGEFVVGESVETRNNPEKLSKKQIASFMKRDDSTTFHFQAFDDYSNVEPSGKMVVRGVNSAAINALGREQVDMPFYGKPRAKEPFVKFLDGHKNCQLRYLRDWELKNYMPKSIEQKMSERMGFGIAATGIRDNIPTLSFNGAHHVLSCNYSEMAGESFNLLNWRNQFSASLLNEEYSRNPGNKELEAHLRNHIEKKVRAEQNPFKRKVMSAMINGDYRTLVKCLAEMDRTLARKDCEFRKMGYGVNSQKYSDKPFKIRLASCLKVANSWVHEDYYERLPDELIAQLGRTTHVKRGVSSVMYLASSKDDDPPCFRDGHRKCMTLGLILGGVDSEVRRKLLVESFATNLSAIHFATRTGWPCQLDVLLKYGASTEVTSDHFKTPLHYAIRRNMNLLARQLMWHGADLSSVIEKANEYEEPLFAPNGYLSKKFIEERYSSLRNVFVSWVDAFLADCDNRISMKYKLPRSHLQQCRIGLTVEDRVSYVPEETMIKKMSLTMLPREGRGPIVLFMIPCSYTKMDTTMNSQYPHIVKVPMVERAREAFNELELNVNRMKPANDAERVEVYGKGIETMRPLRLLSEPPLIAFSDGEHMHEVALRSMFRHEHNGGFYAYLLPDLVDRVKKNTKVSLTLIIDMAEIESYQNSFFMVQACQLQYEQIDLEKERIEKENQEKMWEDGDAKRKLNQKTKRD